MRALDLVTALNAKGRGIVGWGLFVADVADLKHHKGEVTAYRVQGVELSRPKKEIHLVIEYPDRPGGEATAMTAGQFLDRLRPLASDYPDYPVEASVEVDLVFGNQRWTSYDMPVRGWLGSEGACALLLGVEGLRELARYR